MKLTVKAFNDKSIVKQSKRFDDRGTLRLEGESYMLDANNNIYSKKLTTFVTMPKEAIKALNLDRDGADYNACTKAAGMEASRIVVRETTTREHESNKAKVYPSSHSNAGEAILDPSGNEIYRFTSLVPMSSPINDVLVITADQAAKLNLSEVTTEVVTEEGALS